MEINVGDILTMKKPHPCGGNSFLVTRTGCDVKIRCQKCGREVLVARPKIIKSIKKITAGVVLDNV